MSGTGGWSRSDWLVAVRTLLWSVAALLALFWIANLWPERASPLAIRRRCEANLSGVGNALHLYAYDYGGYFPESLEQLVDLQYLPDDSVLHCPAVKEYTPGHIDYMYVKDLTIDSRPYAVVAFDKIENHRKHYERRNVLFVDGDVKWIAKERFQELLAEQLPKPPTF